MSRVVFEIVAGHTVHQDVEAAAVLVEPGDNGIEPGVIEGELATPVRVRPHQSLMDAADADVEQFARSAPA